MHRQCKTLFTHALNHITVPLLHVSSYNISTNIYMTLFNWTRV